MVPRANPTAVEPPRTSRPLLWVLAVLFFGVGDVVTTSVGMGIEGLLEFGPVTAVVLGRYGFGGMVVAKALVFGGCFLVWRCTRRPYSVGVPLGLTVVGVFVTGWNLYLLALVAPA